MATPIDTAVAGNQKLDNTEGGIGESHNTEETPTGEPSSNISKGKKSQEDDNGAPSNIEGEPAISSKTNGSRGNDAPDEEATKKTFSKVKQIWAKIGLDKGTVAMMFKGSVAPTIAVAFYQGDSVRVNRLS